MIELVLFTSTVKQENAQEEIAADVSFFGHVAKPGITPIERYQKCSYSRILQ